MNLLPIYGKMRTADSLDDLMSRRFVDEERCMAEHDYPFIDLQKDRHDCFARYFASLREEMRDSSRRLLLFRTQVFVIDWLVNHTSKLDRYFGYCLKTM